MNEGFDDKTMDRKLTVVPTPVELAEKRRQANEAAGVQGVAQAGMLNNRPQTNPPWEREKCVAAIIKAYEGPHMVADVSKIVRDAQVLYDYIIEGKIPPEGAPKGTSFHARPA